MEKLRIASIENTFYPTPKRRIENPVETELQPGDLVRARIGRVKGDIGIVVVERNGNYEDYEPYVNRESIGVEFVEGVDLAPELLTVVKHLAESNDLQQTVVRWFDNTDQLELLGRAL